MAVGPFALWRPPVAGAGATTTQRRPLEGSWFDEIAEIYFACGQRGVGPRDADDLELWEIGGLIGANHPGDDAGDARMPDVPNDWNVRRIMAMEAGEPEPTHDDVMSVGERQTIGALVEQAAANV